MSIETIEAYLRGALSRVKNKALHLRFLKARYASKTMCVHFQCNICGQESISPIVAVESRESSSCYHCGSNKRFRSIIAALSQALFGEYLSIPSFKKSKNITGLGLSNTRIYAVPLSQFFSYENTYYHKTPRLDITAIDSSLHNTLDFIISSDVFEHIPVPVSLAFSNAFKLLKPGGVCAVCSL